MSLTPFHVAVQVRDLDEARRYYGGVLGCAQGRCGTTWIDCNMYGHQFVCHLNRRLGREGNIASHYNAVDGHGVPVPHCGVVLSMQDWTELAQRLRDRHAEFVIEPCIRFAGLPGEQATMFLLDPSGNALEFKGFADIAKQLFAT